MTKEEEKLKKENEELKIKLARLEGQVEGMRMRNSNPESRRPTAEEELAYMKHCLNSSR